jgi:DNA modification methylase
MISIAMARRVEQWPIDRLIPYLGNARTHSDKQVSQIARSIVSFGFNNPIAVDAGGNIIAGHGRLLGAQKLGLTQVPVIVLDHLTEVQKRAYRIADNQIALNAGWDDARLQAQLTSLQNEDFNLDLLGFEDQLSQLLAAQDTECGLTDEDAVPELPETPVSVPGDLWNLDDHRLRVGDATRQSDVESLMAGETAHLIFTDPPFNVDYEGYTKDRLKIQGDRMSAGDFNQFLEAALRSLRSVAKPESSLYIGHPSSWQREFQNALEAAEFQVRCQIIWAKNTFAWGFGRYKFQHEPIFYCHISGKKDRWYGDKSQSTLWEVAKPSANRIHPTSKPVELIERALLNSSESGDLVADLFGGSGSTLIACERRGRRARLLEIDPKYADCIVRRWQDYSGKKAILENGGCSFEETTQQRRREAGIQ